MNANFDDLSLLMTVKEMAAVLRIGRNAAYQLVADGHIHTIKVGNQIRVPRNALIQFVQQPQPQPQ